MLSKLRLPNNIYIVCIVYIYIMYISKLCIYLYYVYIYIMYIYTKYGQKLECVSFRISLIDILMFLYVLDFQFIECILYISNPR